MPDDDTETHDEDSPVIKELRSKAKRTDDAETETKALRQENALLKAGITDLSTAKQTALLAAHEGDMDAEALRKTAVDLGFLTEEPDPKPEPQVPAEEVAGHERVQAATAGAESADANLPKLDDLIKGAKTEAELEKILANAGIEVNASE